MNEVPVPPDAGMADRKPAHDQPHVEEHKVYALLALPIFLVTVLIIILIAWLGTAPRP